MVTVRPIRIIRKRNTIEEQQKIIPQRGCQLLDDKFARWGAGQRALRLAQRDLKRNPEEFPVTLNEVMAVSDIAKISATLGGLLIAFVALVARGLADAIAEERTVRPRSMGKLTNGRLVFSVPSDYWQRMPVLARRILFLRIGLYLAAILAIVSLMTAAVAIWGYYQDLSLIPGVVEAFFVEIGMISVAIIIVAFRGVER